jgi:EAL domain-containing protein (putative c-di-GMP-specific phosphodiesterase class I)
MGVRTVAEGVESADVLAALALIGVNFAQGNWVRRAVPLVQMHTLIGNPDDSGLQRVLAAPRVSARSSPAR